MSRLLLALALLVSVTASAQPATIDLKDIDWDPKSPAGMTELRITSAGSLLAGFL